MKANQALVDLLGRIAKKKNATPAQIAIAWLLGQKPWIVPIPGTTKFHRLEENLGAVNVELTGHDLAEIERAASARATPSGSKQRPAAKPERAGSKPAMPTQRKLRHVRRVCGDARPQAWDCRSGTSARRQGARRMGRQKRLDHRTLAASQSRFLRKCS
jgi:Aldo/keto reductase family